MKRKVALFKYLWPLAAALLLNTTANGYSDSPTAICVWQGAEFAQLKNVSVVNNGGFSLNINGNTVSPNGENIIVTGEHGVLIDWTQQRSSLTLLVWCTVPYVSAPSALLTLAAKSWGEEPDIVGAAIGNNDNVSGIWLGSAYSQGEEGSFGDHDRPVCIALRYDGGSGYVGNTVGGTDAFIVSDETITGIYHGAYLKRASAKVFGASIGGTRSSGDFCSMEGMVISKVALFNSFLGAEDIKKAANGDFSIDAEETTDDASSELPSVTSWGGDFSNTNENAEIVVENGFTLSLNNNTLSSDGSRVVITSDRGVLVDWESGMTNLTVMAWVRLPSSASSSTLMTLKSSSDSDFIGVIVDSNGETVGLYEGVSYSHPTVKNEAISTILAQGKTVCMALRYNRGFDTPYGTELLLVGDGTPVSIYRAPYLKSFGEMIMGASIGGARSSTDFDSIAGCLVYRVAIYDVWLSDAQIEQFAGDGMPDSYGQDIDDSRYTISDSTGDRTIASLSVNDDIMLDTIVVKNGKVYDTVLRIENTASKDIKVTLPGGYTYETFKGMSPLTIPAQTINILTITRTANKVFLVSREELEVLQ